MGSIALLDCTLRDGGYINDWYFGEYAIKTICRKLVAAGIRFIEVGFIKGDNYIKDRAVFPDLECIKEVISPKHPETMYMGMVDMSDPIPLDRIKPYDGSSVDAIRVIFKKDKIDEGYRYCEVIKNLGYKVFAQAVGTDLYTDKEFIELIERFNTLEPYAFSIVDTFGLIKRRHFLRLVQIADNNLKSTIGLGYHSHNNLQQAFGNAEAFIDLGLRRDIYIDACVFGMGRGAGNLNLELFAGYMNENCGADFRIEPILEIIDEFLNDIYRKKFWGYSLPYYLSSTNGCHPNYAKYFSEKNTLTVKSFNELLNSIPSQDRIVYSKEKAEQYYITYMQNYIDDKRTLDELSRLFANRRILLLAPGRSLIDYKSIIIGYISNEKPIVVTVNFVDDEFGTDYVFSSNMRRYSHIQNRKDVKRIITSNIKDADDYDYIINFSSFSSRFPDIVDNSGLMAIRLMLALGIQELTIAGMDGYAEDKNLNYYHEQLVYDFSSEAVKRNELISQEIKDIRKQCKLEFLTPTLYSV